MQETAQLLTELDVQALNRSRRILRRLETAAGQAAWEASGGDASSLGRLAETASAGEAALFHVLNVAQSHCGVVLTRAQLHEDARAES